MPEFERVDEAQYSPGVCALCRTHQGPFVLVHAVIPDVPVTSVDGNLAGTDPGEGRLNLVGAFYVCIGKGPAENGDYENGCARQIAALADCLNPPEVHGLHATMDAYRTKTVELEQALADEQAKPKVISVDDILELVRQSQAPPGTPAPFQPAPATRTA